MNLEPVEGLKGLLRADPAVTLPTNPRPAPFGPAGRRTEPPPIADRPGNPKGGAIDNGGTMTVSGCAITGNTAPEPGAGDVALIALSHKTPRHP